MRRVAWKKSSCHCQVGRNRRAAREHMRRARVEGGMVDRWGRREWRKMLGRVGGGAVRKVLRAHSACLSVCVLCVCVCCVCVVCVCACVLVCVCVCVCVWM